MKRTNTNKDKIEQKNLEEQSPSGGHHVPINEAPQEAKHADSTSSSRSSGSWSSRSVNSISETVGDDEGGFGSFQMV